LVSSDGTEKIDTTEDCFCLQAQEFANFSAKLADIGLSKEKIYEFGLQLVEFALFG
jgi:hypothetical protein